ncbi:membrane protein [Vibrio zhanjiangensis]|uniref:Membrane protein n=1 Tax=Vibrio zhanjiangensis TaxID=1046128 RepID=A0ABQ6F2T0_9VIBR|nr:DUF418 domain-containing protein [Vibrio zhanjiangensis]GLT19828.1 membrane protein [Vibrio zhanjiangensis]
MTDNRDGRIDAIDMLRGFALVGILMANILWHSGFLDSPMSVRIERLNVTFLDQALLFFTRLFVHGKFYYIYSLLFGLGFYILYSRYKGNERVFPYYFVKRQSILFLIGCIHALFIWWGDILRYYAILGVLLMLVRDWSTRSLLILSATLLLLPVAQDIAKYYGISTPTIDLAHGFKKSQLYSLYQQGEWFSANFQRLIFAIESNFNTGRLYKSTSMFLLGYCFGRTEFFSSSDAKQRMKVQLMIAAIIVAFPAGILKAMMQYTAISIKPELRSIALELLYLISVTGMALGYAAAIAYFSEHLKRAKLGNAFCILGRLPLTNYLMQSLIGLLLFHATGLFSKLSLSWVYLIALAIILGQLLFSHHWLKSHKTGPIEEIWRKLASQ